MEKTTAQMKAWTGEFGQAYTDRNPHSLKELDALYYTNYGVTRTRLNEDFLGTLDPDSSILEVGTNVGTQLQALSALGFRRLFGIELQAYAASRARVLTSCATVIQGSAFDLPFRDGHFDLVFTSGLLIHVSPSDVGAVLDEIHRCSKQYIWGMEYYSDEYVSVRYREKEDLLWKTDFASLYLRRFADLDLVRERRLKYLNAENVDSMFLLRKRNAT